jgi:hypothetical protein
MSAHFPALRMRLARRPKPSSKVAKSGLELALLPFRKGVNLDFEQLLLSHHAGTKLLVTFQFFLQALILNGQVIDNTPIVVGATAMGDGRSKVRDLVGTSPEWERVIKRDACIPDLVVLRIGVSLKEGRLLVVHGASPWVSIRPIKPSSGIIVAGNLAALRRVPRGRAWTCPRRRVGRRRFSGYSGISRELVVVERQRLLGSRSPGQRMAMVDMQLYAVGVRFTFGHVSL